MASRADRPRTSGSVPGAIARAGATSRIGPCSITGRLTGVGPAGAFGPASRPCGSGAVGGTPSRRSVASATARKIGAATSPPVRPPRRGESRMARITARGCRDGTKPTNDTLLWTFE